jgi:hypothetical protein
VFINLFKGLMFYFIIILVYISFTGEKQVAGSHSNDGNEAIT